MKITTIGIDLAKDVVSSPWNCRAGQGRFKAANEARANGPVLCKLGSHSKLTKK
jgi:hypothetical protein